MNDELLRALGRTQREELDDEREPADPELDELARPFDQDERASILDAMFAQVGEPETAARSEPDQPKLAPDQAPAKIIELAPRRRMIVAGAVLAAAAAALALLWWSSPNPGAQDRDADLLAMVPPYEITRLRGGIAGQRSEPAQAQAALTLHADSTIDWVLTPAEPTRDPVGLALLARSDNHESLFAARLDAELTEAGVLHLHGPLNRYIELAPGSWTLTLLIAKPDALPVDASAASRALEGSGQALPWRSVAVRVTIVATE